MTVVQCVAGLAQGAEEIAGDENHAKQQHALIQPASHTPCQRGGQQGHWGGNQVARMRIQTGVESALGGVTLLGGSKVLGSKSFTPGVLPLAGCCPTGVWTCESLS